MFTFTLIGAIFAALFVASLLSGEGRAHYE
jgi:hypothetical protein